MYPTEYVILQSDLYDFYSMSFNNFSNPDIFFNANFIAIPENYRDYLWASKQSEYVYGNNYIQFIYKHISTKINIIVTSPESFSNVSINHIKFTLPNCSSSFIDLKKGEIASASAVLALSELNGIGNSRTFITIPCHAQKQIEISVNATIDGEPINDLIYRSYIDNHFIGGVSYTVNVNIENLSNSSISFICNDWNYNSNYIPY